MSWILLLVLIYKKTASLIFLRSQVTKRISLLEEALFYISRSMDRDFHLLIIDKLVYSCYQLVLVFIIVVSLAGPLGIDFKTLVYILIFLLVLLIIYANSLMTKNRVLLARELSRFIFLYELFLIQGDNQFKALFRACDELKVIPAGLCVEDYLDSFQELFRYTKWLVVKRITILIERSRHFTQKDMSMEFVQISDELFRKTYHDRRLEAEKIENMMLLPMIGDLLIMIVYVISPFLGSLLGG